MWNCKPMWHCKYSVIFESKVQFGEKYMKMSKCENSLFPYFLFYCKTSCMEAERHKCYFSFFSPSIQWDSYSRKNFIFQNLCQILPKLTKSVRNCQHPILWRNHQNWNLSFRNFLLKCETRINDKDLHDKEQKIYTNVFYFYLLKERSPKIISWIFNKRKLLARSCKISRRDKY